jgi:hypothetical protein
MPARHHEDRIRKLMDEGKKVKIQEGRHKDNTRQQQQSQTAIIILQQILQYSFSDNIHINYNEL